MPEVFEQNKHWTRGGNKSKKRHTVSIGEDENIARCKGIKDGHICKNPLFLCKCGNWGCDQDVTEKCTLQGFKNSKCLHCGEVGNNVPLTDKQYETLPPRKGETQ